MRLPLSDVPAFQRDPLRLVFERAQSAPLGFVPLYLAMRPIWLATDPAVARSVLKWPEEEIDKGKLVQRLRPIVGESLLTNIGPDHHRTKTAIHRHVQRNAAVKSLERMMAAINACAARIAQDGLFDAATESAPLALQLGCLALFGHEVITLADRMALITAVQTVESELAADMFRILPQAPWKAREREGRLNHAREIVDMVVARARTNKQKSAIILALESAGLTDRQISTEILGLLIAGHHTTGATITWILYHLALDPMIAEMIALEADSALPGLELGDATALRHAPLSQTYVREILRLYPAGWWTSREVARPTTVGGKSFRTGDIIMVSPWQLHHDPRLWSEPGALKLDRDFTEEAYMPFGIGPRSCIGQSIAWFELQLVTLQLASAFTFALEEEVASAEPRPSVTLLAPAFKLKAMPRTETAFRQHREVA